jgi:hypothetical protein
MTQKARKGASTGEILVGQNGPLEYNRNLEYNEKMKKFSTMLFILLMTIPGCSGDENIESPIDEHTILPEPYIKDEFFMIPVDIVLNYLPEYYIIEKTEDQFVFGTGDSNIIISNYSNEVRKNDRIYYTENTSDFVNGNIFVSSDFFLMVLNIEVIYFEDAIKTTNASEEISFPEEMFLPHTILFLKSNFIFKTELELDKNWSYSVEPVNSIGLLDEYVYEPMWGVMTSETGEYTYTRIGGQRKHLRFQTNTTGQCTIIFENGAKEQYRFDIVIVL